MPSESVHWPRHGWVRLGEGWAASLRSPLPPAERAEVADWCAAGRPLVIARGRPGDGAGELRLGLATPDKRRIGLDVAVDAVAERLDPLPLAEVVETAPEAWRAMLAELVRRVSEELRIPVFADCSNLDEGKAAEQMGAAYVSSTLSGYVDPNAPKPEGPDLKLIEDLAKHCTVPVIAEGRFNTPELARQALEAGAHAVVVGTMITNPREITRAFAAEVMRAR